MHYHNYILSFHTIYFLEDKDHCLEHVCLNGATCKNGASAYTCLCHGGWTGNYCDTGKSVLLAKHFIREDINANG